MKKQSVVSMLIAVIAMVVAAHFILTPHTVATGILSAEEKEVEVVVTETPSTPTPTPTPPPEVVATSPPSPTPSPTPLTPDEYVATDGQEYAYVPGFGYIPCGGESQITSVPGMVENGNKIGSMG